MEKVPLLTEPDIHDSQALQCLVSVLGQLWTSLRANLDKVAYARPTSWAIMHQIDSKSSKFSKTRPTWSLRKLMHLWSVSAW